MKQEPASKNKDGTIIQFPSFENRKQSKGLILFPILSGILCAAIFGLILNLLLEKPEQQSLLAEPPEETSLFEVPAFTFWVLQAGAFSSENAAGDFISKLPADTPHVLVPQDDMYLLWIGAAGTEEKAKSLSAEHSGEVYIKSVSIDPFQLSVSEKDHKWLSDTFAAIRQKLDSPETAMNVPSGDQPENEMLQQLFQSIQQKNKDAAFLDSLSSTIQLKAESSASSEQ